MQTVADRKLRMVDEQLTEANAKVRGICLVLLMSQDEHMTSHDNWYYVTVCITVTCAPPPD